MLIVVPLLGVALALTVRVAGLRYWAALAGALRLTVGAACAKALKRPNRSAAPKRDTADIGVLASGVFAGAWVAVLVVAVVVVLKVMGDMAVVGFIRR